MQEGARDSHILYRAAHGLLLTSQITYLHYLLTYLFPIPGSRDWKFLNPESRI